MKKYVGLFIVLVMVLVINAKAVGAQDARSFNVGETICAMDAKLCPDGSYVSRTGPNCEFTACLNSIKPEEPETLPLPQARNEMEVRREVFRNALKTDREAFLEELKIKREEFRLANAQRREEFRQKAKRMIGERFNVAVRNLERMQTRIGNIIEKLNTDGKNTDIATDYLNSSEEKLGNAKVKIAEIEALLPTDSGKITPEIFEQIKLLAREAKDLLKESHNDLVQAIKELKGLKEITN